MKGQSAPLRVAETRKASCFRYIEVDMELTISDVLNRLPDHGADRRVQKF